MIPVKASVWRFDLIIWKVGSKIEQVMLTTAKQALGRLFKRPRCVWSLCSKTLQVCTSMLTEALPTCMFSF